jgi:hypothetical protein
MPMIGKPTAVAAAAGALLLSGMIAAPAPAAVTHDCVSDHEFSLVKPGWTKDRVHRLFDVRGVRTSYSNFDGFIDESRAYRACREPGATRMYIWYDNYSSSGHGMRVYSKQFTRQR